MEGFGPIHLKDEELMRKIDCPRCRKTMKQVSIKNRDDHVLIDHCGFCEGYWFDNEELDKLIDDRRYGPFLDLDPADVHEANFNCPRCGGITETKSLFNVLVDLCVECHGLWLDRGELREIQKKYDISMSDSRLMEIINSLVTSEPSPLLPSP